MTHLHLHTHISSILDGIGRPKEYAELAEKYGHKACAITDHGRVGGLLEFQKELEKKEVKPILGCEFYIADELTTLNDRGKRIRNKSSH